MIPKHGPGHRVGDVLEMGAALSLNLTDSGTAQAMRNLA